MKITVDGVGASLGGRPILTDLRLEVASGSLTAVVGPNGSGKSTLLRVIYRALRPRTGTVRLGATDVWRSAPRQSARLRAVVPQHQPTPSELLVSDVVGLGRHPHLRWYERPRHQDREAVDAAIAVVGIGPLVDRPIGSLSGGERQRVLLARAMAQRAPVLLLDEPTNHLDPRSQLDLLHLVAELDCTRVVVLHDLDQALAVADRVAVIDRGRLVAHDVPERALDRETIDAVFHLDSRIVPHPIADRAHLTYARRTRSPIRHSAGPGQLAP